MAHRKIYAILVFMAVFSLCQAQGEANHWYFGFNAGLDFSSGTPVVVTNGQVNTLEGCSSISTPEGELLFYTDGMSVWNKNHQVMPNGFGLMGHSSSTQSAIIVPKPEDEDIFFIFTVDAEENYILNGLRYSVVDMKLNGGLGNVTSEKNILLDDMVLEKVTAVQHGTENKYWVITHLWANNEFHAYQVDESGVVTPPVVSLVGDVIFGSYDNAKGYLKISPDGKWLAMANNTMNSLLLFEFNNVTGEISNQIKDERWSEALYPYGVEFSPNSELLYACNWRWSIATTKLYQYDLSVPTSFNILSSRVELASGVDLFAAMQLGPDGKIYLAHPYTHFLGYINQPNIYGSGCEVELSSIYLNGKQSSYGLPPFIQSFFNVSADFFFEGHCLGDETQFYEDSSQDPDSVSWDFGDVASGAANYSSLLNPTHVFSSTGLFSVSLVAFFEGEADSISKTVSIHDAPQVNLGNDTAICSGNIILLDAGSGYQTYLWQNGYAGQTISTDTAGLFWVEVGNDQGCYDRDSILLEAAPVYTSTIDTSACQGESVMIGNNVYTTAGIYHDTLVSSWGCDSILVTTLTVHDTFGITDNVSICAGDSIWAGGGWQYQGGIFYDYFSTMEGCDSNIITTLLVHDTFRITDYISICTGDSVWLGGGWQYQSGTFKDYFISVEACDSTIITQLTVDDIISVNMQANICEGDSFFAGGNWQTQAGIYFDTTTSVHGCDSVTVLDLMIHDNFEMTVDTSICEGDSIYLGNMYCFIAGNYHDQFISSAGCDSIVNTSLVIEYPPEVWLGNDTILQIGVAYDLDAWYPGASYEWQDGSTASTYTVSQEGYYHVTLSNNCGYASDTIYLAYEDFSCRFVVPNAFTPNSDGLNDVFLPEFNCALTEYALIIFDRWGSKVYETNTLYGSWDGTINGKPAPGGLYTWVLKYSTQAVNSAGLHTESGAVMLIR